MYSAHCSLSLQLLNCSCFSYPLCTIPGKKKPYQKADPASTPIATVNKSILTSNNLPLQMHKKKFPALILQSLHLFVLQVSALLALLTLH